jgi:tetratricopeptide (TPR) repeat protein
MRWMTVMGWSLTLPCLAWATPPSMPATDLLHLTPSIQGPTAVPQNEPPEPVVTISPPSPRKKSRIAITVDHPGKHDTSSRSLDRGLQEAREAIEWGHQEAAMVIYERLLQEHPRALPVQSALARLYVQESLVDRAEPLYRTMLKENPDNLAVVSEYLSWQAKDHPEKAIAMLQDALFEHPRHAYLHAQLGMIYADTQQWERAILSLRKAAYFDPTNLLYVYNMAIALEHLGNHSEAYANYRQLEDRLQQAPYPGLSLRMIQQRILILGTMQ